MVGGFIGKTMLFASSLVITSWAGDLDARVYLESGEAASIGMLAEADDGWYSQGDDSSNLLAKQLVIAAGQSNEGFCEIDGSIYYLLDTGEKVIGFYHLENSSPNTNQMIYANQQGVVQRGWFNVDGAWYYAFPDSFVLLSDGWFFDQQYQGWYYFEDNKMLRGCWKGEYFLDENGKMAESEWMQLADGAWIYLGKDGKRVSEGWVLSGEDWYYLQSGGNMASSTWIGDYYLESSGKMAKNKTIGNYYVDINGKYCKSVSMDVPFYSQYPDAVNGCEAYALTQALHYKNYAKEYTAYQLSKQVPISSDGNPNTGFVGKQYSHGSSVATIYPKAILPLAQKYAPDSLDASGYSLDQMKAEILNGNPVVIWGSLPKFEYPRLNHYWFGLEPTNGHAIVLAGFEDQWFYCIDSVSGKYWVTSDKVATSYNLRGKMALVIK